MRIFINSGPSHELFPVRPNNLMIYKKVINDGILCLGNV